MKEAKAWVVAVDGPAASGKSSICAKVCEELGFVYINTGLLYRAIGYAMMHAKVSLEDEARVLRTLEDFLREFSWDLKTNKIMWQGRDIAPHLSSVEAGAMASAVGKLPKLRTRLLSVQRDLAAKVQTGVLLEGRDIGTVVFPEAQLKVFLTASIEARATRRLLQIEKDQPAGPLPRLADLMAALAARDLQDSQRAAAPLVKSPDAVLLDTSALNFQQSVAALKKLIVKARATAVSSTDSVKS